MKHWKKGLCGLLAAVLMAPAGLAAPVNGEKGLSDLEGHWERPVILHESFSEYVCCNHAD